jgi:hypothetical protein
MLYFGRNVDRHSPRIRRENCNFKFRMRLRTFNLRFHLYPVVQILKVLLNEGGNETKDDCTHFICRHAFVFL